MAKPTAVTPADLIPTKARQEATMRARGIIPSAELTPMQFRMPPDFANAFRVEATKRGLKYNEFLELCFDTFIKAAKE